MVTLRPSVRLLALCLHSRFLSAIFFRFNDRNAPHRRRSVEQRLVSFVSDSASISFSSPFISCGHWYSSIALFLPYAPRCSSPQSMLKLQTKLRTPSLCYVHVGHCVKWERHVQMAWELPQMEHRMLIIPVICLFPMSRQELLLPPFVCFIPQILGFCCHFLFSFPFAFAVSTPFYAYRESPLPSILSDDRVVVNVAKRL